MEQVNDYSMIEIQKSKDEILATSIATSSDMSLDIDMPKADKERRNLTVTDTERIHKEHVSWLMNEIEKIQNENDKCQTTESRKQLVILTHHAPTDYQCIDPAVTNEVSVQMNFCHLEHLFQYPVSAWFFGHTHYNMECVVESLLETDKKKEKEKEKVWHTILASNQQGYLHPKVSDGYQIDKVYELPVKKIDHYNVVTYEKINTFSFMKRLEILEQDVEG